jgi:serine/threonine protein kinase
MNDSSASDLLCERCGSAAPGGICPRCVMGQIVEPTESGAASAMLPPFTPEELAPYFPQLEIIECLGRGGMGVVYKARQKSLNRFVALKLLAPERADDPDFGARFAKEAQALAALNHSNIVAVHDFGQAGGFYFLLMEFVDGVNLRQLLRTRQLKPQEALSIVPPICDALQCAHARGIVHRDIKPENLLLDRTGQVKIADFGIAKLLGGGNDEDGAHQGHTPGGMTRTFAGTPDYAAPEQRAPNGVADHRADIYSLGVVLYEMLTGERPKQNIVPPSKRVQVDIRIDEIVLRALEDKPELRFATVEEFRTQLNSVPRGGGASRHTMQQAAKWAALFIIPVLSLIVAFYAWTQNPSAKRPKVVETIPKTGAVDVDPAMKELRVVFNRPMAPGGMSIVGGGPNFPNFTDNSRWEDDRTFVIGWQLKPEHDYSLSFNSSTYTNFRGANGEPCVPFPLSFRTGKTRDGQVAFAPNANSAANHEAIASLPTSPQPTIQ